MNLEEVIFRALESTVKAQLDKLHVCCPGVVLSYDDKTQLASVKLVSSMNIDATDETPEIDNVPVQFVSGGRASFVFRLEKDDPVLVHFCDVDVTGWVHQGTIRQAVSKRRFNLNDCYAVPGGAPKGKVSLGSDNVAELIAGDATIEFKKSGSVLINNHLEVTQ